MGHYDSLVEHVNELVMRLLMRRMIKDKNKAEKIARKLTREFKYHGRAITYVEAQEIGLKIEVLSKDLEKAVLNFYQKVKDLYTFIDDLISILPPGVTLTSEKYEIKHGIIYLPIPKRGLVLP